MISDNGANGSFISVKVFSALGELEGLVKITKNPRLKIIKNIRIDIDEERDAKYASVLLKSIDLFIREPLTSFPNFDIFAKGDDVDKGDNRIIHDDVRCCTR